MILSKPLSTISFEEGYKQIRNRLRRFHPDSIISQTINILQNPVEDRFDDVRRTPWQTLLLVKWACQDKMAGLQSSTNATLKDIDQIRQLIWSLPDRLSNFDPASQSLYLMIRRVMHAQIGLQRNKTQGLVREAAILSTLDNSHPLRNIFREKTKLEPDEFLDFSLATYGALVDKSINVPLSYFSPLLKNYSDNKLSAYFDCVSRNIEELFTFFRLLPDTKRKVMSELYEFPVLSRYPFLKTRNHLRCWHQTVFFRGIEGMVHSILSEEGSDYSEKFGHVFEKHVLELAALLDTDFYTELEISTFLPDETKCPDALLSFSGCNVFVEAKSGLFDESVMTVGSNEIFSRKMREITNAIKQGCSASDGIRKTGIAPEQILKATRDYLLIVTNKELSVSRGTIFSEICPPGTFDFLASRSDEYYSLDNIYIISIEDYERIMESSRRNEIDIPVFLDACKTSNQSPETSRYYMEQHLTHHQIPYCSCKLVSNAINESVKRLEQSLSTEILTDKHD